MKDWKMNWKEQGLQWLDKELNNCAGYVETHAGTVLNFDTIKWLYSMDIVLIDGEQHEIPFEYVVAGIAEVIV